MGLGAAGAQAGSFLGKSQLPKGHWAGEALEGVGETTGAAISMVLKTGIGAQVNPPLCSLSVCGNRGLSRHELRFQYWGKGRQKRERDGPKEREEAPPTLPWGLWEGAYSPLRIGEWPPPYNMAMYKENWGQIVHCALGNPQNPWGLPNV